MPDIRNDGRNYSNKTEGGVRKAGNRPKLDAAKEQAEKRIAAHPEDFAPREPKPESKKIGGTRAER